MSTRARSTSPWLAPTPPTVAIEIASRRVTVASMGSSGRGLSLRAYASEPLPAGAVTPALSGENVRDRDAVAGALERALGRAGLRSAGRAALIVPDSVGRVSLVGVEQVPARAADLEQLLRWQLRKATPFPIDEARLSHFVAHADATGTTLATITARRDVVAQYEAVTDALDIHAGIVDLASLNVANAVIGSGAADGDWLLVCLTPEATSLLIMRGSALMFYRQRATLDDEPLGALVHQTAMYHEDRLGGGRFSRAWLCGGTGQGTEGESARRDLEQRLGVAVQAVDLERAVASRDPAAASREAVDALAAPVGVLLRELRAA